MKSVAPVTRIGLLLVAMKSSPDHPAPCAVAAADRVTDEVRASDSESSLSCRTRCLDSFNRNVHVSGAVARLIN